MSSLNKVLLIGNLGADPKSNTVNGKAVSNFSIATSERWTDKDGQLQSKTQWHNIEIWGTKAESCNKYLHKGSKVFVEGRLEVSNYEDKTTGTTKMSVRIVADTVTFLDSRSDDQGGGNQGGWNQGGNQGGGNQGGWNQGGNQGGGNQGGWNQGGNQQQSKQSQPAWGQSSWNANDPNQNWGGGNNQGGDGEEPNMPF